MFFYLYTLIYIYYLQLVYACEEPGRCASYKEYCLIQCEYKHIYNDAIHDNADADAVKQTGEYSQQEYFVEASAGQ